MCQNHLGDNRVTISPHKDRFFDVFTPNKWHNGLVQLRITVGVGGTNSVQFMSIFGFSPLNSYFVKVPGHPWRE
jgi:hypothetical protein